MALSRHAHRVDRLGAAGLRVVQLGAPEERPPTSDSPDEQHPAIRQQRRGVAGTGAVQRGDPAPRPASIVYLGNGLPPAGRRNAAREKNGAIREQRFGIVRARNGDAACRRPRLRHRVVQRRAPKGRGAEEIVAEIVEAADDEHPAVRQEGRVVAVTREAEARGRRPRVRRRVVQLGVVEDGAEVLVESAGDQHFPGGEQRCRELVAIPGGIARVAPRALGRVVDFGER